MNEDATNAAIADRLGCAQQTSWQDYAGSFAEYEWDKFIEAYEHCAYKTY
jgi:hypothetical protein